jgi:hypothetical protein
VSHEVCGEAGAFGEETVAGLFSKLQTLVETEAS